MISLGIIQECYKTRRSYLKLVKGHLRFKGTHQSIGWGFWQLSHEHDLLLLHRDWLLKTYDNINLYFDSSLNTSYPCPKMLYRKAGQLAVKIKELQWNQNQKAKIYFEIFTDPHGENVFPVASVIPVSWCHLNQERLRGCYITVCIFLVLLSLKLFIPIKQVYYVIRE